MVDEGTNVPDIDFLEEYVPTDPIPVCYDPDAADDSCIVAAVDFSQIYDGRVPADSDAGPTCVGDAAGPDGSDEYDIDFS